MRHLTTDELLLHCDGTLASELAVHLKECSACRDAWLNLQAVLFEAEEAIRGSLAPESVQDRIASRLALERALYPPRTNAGFPLRWSAVYAVAAALTMMVLSGYLSTRLQSPVVSPAPQMASTRQATPDSRQPGPVAQPRMAVATTELTPSVAENAVEAAAVTQQVAGSAEMLLAESSNPAPGDDAAQLLEADAAAPTAQTPTNGEPAKPEVQLARFELGADAASPIASQQFAWIDPPKVSSSPSSTELAAMVSPVTPAAGLPGSVEEAPGADSDPLRVVDPSSLPKLIEGYWLLTQAHVWQEDLQPVWTPLGLRIQGSVEDEAVRSRVEASVLRQAAQPVAFSIRLREELPLGAQSTNRGAARVVRAVHTGPPGGMVRQSLLGHFTDAARRSFVAPQPPALESELVRYVSEVFSNQSELLSHVYALQRFLGRIDAASLRSAGPPVVRQFRDVVHFHLRAVDEREAAIYDRLSEALPRKVWSHRGAEDDSKEILNWQEEGAGLLQDTLQLDSNLTALFGASSLTVDASDLDQSCGELLHRIRSRIHRIKNRTQAF